MAGLTPEELFFDRDPASDDSPSSQAGMSRTFTNLLIFLSLSKSECEILA